MKITEKFKFCLECGDKFYNVFNYYKNGKICGYGKSRWDKMKFCSKKCSGIYDGKRRTGMDETKHPRWKGENVGYDGMHDWVTKHLGQPIGCEVCGINDLERKYHWANVSGKYLRNKSDFKRMCVPCHSKYDHKMRKNESAEILL
jgi:hypothetical protein